MTNGFKIAVRLRSRLDALDEVLDVRLFVTVTFPIGKHSTSLVVGGPTRVADDEVALIAEEC